MAEGRAKLAWDQTSLLWCIWANANRDTKEHPKPFLPSDVHPYRKADDYGSADDGPDVAEIQRIKQTGKVTRIRALRRPATNGKP